MKTEGVLIPQNPLAHPALLHGALRDWLQAGIDMILEASTSQSLIMLQSAHEETSDGRYFTHYELQVSEASAKGENAIKTFGLVLGVRMHKDNEK
nr:MAG: hypothetical protein [Microvirus sp.]